jgi:broad specificity phosphatase PhoE
MEVYLIRHGQTAGNIARRHQSDKTDITKLGEMQALAAAEYVKERAPQYLITSSMLRAVETARIVGEVCGLVPETSLLFIEVEKPPRLNGHLLKSAYSLWFYARWYFGFTGKDEGGETYKMFRERIEQAKKHLESYPADARIVVVSHSVFINFFLIHLCDSRPMGLLRALHCFVRILTMKNGSVIKVVYEASSPKTCSWRVEKTT